MSGTPVLVVTSPGSALPEEFDAVRDVAEIICADNPDDFRAGLQRTDVAYLWDCHTPLLRSEGPGELRWIHTNSVGLDAILIPEVVDSSIVVTNTRGVFEPPMAEWVLAALLYLVKDMRRTIESQRAVFWDHRAVHSIKGRRVLLLGPGGVGREIARMLRVVGMDVDIVGRSARTDDELGPVHGLEDLDDLLSQADDVVVALPLTAQTRGIIDADRIARLKPGAHLVNVGRGPLIDEPALVQALQDRRIAGAALDVFDTEPLPVQSPLWAMENVLVSPHMSGDVIGWPRQSVKVFTDNLQRWRAGEPLANVVDKAGMAVTAG
ncbi:D-2-hydroxyacid dehydrogenase [Mycolicibacterium vaccae]|uniref:D-2-hydroxyacid dehydrogenase n=1 Tax=Mycolicibacterium vaccae TaxID=1810 RepID=UPI003D011C8F